MSIKKSNTPNFEREEAPSINDERFKPVALENFKSLEQPLPAAQEA